MNYQCKIDRVYETEVLVIGGGPAGFGAAVAAARNGAKTMLIEQNSVLGGMSTSGLVGPFMTCYDNDCTEQLVKGVFDELCLRTEEMGGAIHPSKISGMNTYNSYYLASHEHVTPYLSETLDVVMDQMVTEANKYRLDDHMGNAYSWRVQEGKKTAEWKIDKNEIGMYESPIPGRFKVNTTRMSFVDATNTEHITSAMMEGRKQIQDILAFMRKNVPGCEKVELIQVAPSLEVRETRHIVGKYELTTEDVLNRAIFEDAVCTFAYALDVHLSEGGGVIFTCVDKYYTIPYRCMLPVGCDNLLVAGRCICGSSEAAASYRVMPACVALGQAAGTAAAIAVRDGLTPEAVPMNELKRTLVAQGAVIKEQ